MNKFETLEKKNVLVVLVIRRWRIKAVAVVHRLLFDNISSVYFT